VNSVNPSFSLFHPSSGEYTAVQRYNKLARQLATNNVLLKSVCSISERRTRYHYDFITIILAIALAIFELLDDGLYSFAVLFSLNGNPGVLFRWLPHPSGANS
jgi:hypothetical protein